MPAPKKVNKILNIIFNAQVSEDSMGGGDKIVTSISKELQNDGFNVNYLGSPEGIGMAKANVKNCGYYEINNYTTQKYGFIKTYLLRIIFAYKVLTLPVDSNSIVWAASDFLPDVIPAFWLKLRYPKTYWVGNLFLRARNPFKNEVTKNSTTILYFFSQKIALLLYKVLADRVCVLCQDDFDLVSKYFGASNRVCLISGGIDTKNIYAVHPDTTVQYDACFIGRFHEQKGVPTLIKVWNDVNKKLGKKHLAIIGWGNETETNNLNKLIQASQCIDVIHVLGFLDREDKIKVLKASKILLFPSSFESWGVVIAEALGSGTPVIAFNLQQIKNNFTEGVLWSKNYEEFVNNTIKMLSNTKDRAILANKAHNYSKNLDWKYSAQKFTKNINY